MYILRKIGRKTWLVQTPSTKPGVALILKAPLNRIFHDTRHIFGEVPGQLRGWYARDHYSHVWISDERPGRAHTETRASNWDEIGIYISSRDALWILPDMHLEDEWSRQEAPQMSVQCPVRLKLHSGFNLGTPAPESPSQCWKRSFRRRWWPWWWCFITAEIFREIAGHILTIFDP